MMSYIDPTTPRLIRRRKKLLPEEDIIVENPAPPDLPDLATERKEKRKAKELKIGGESGKGKVQFENGTTTENGVREGNADIREQVQQETSKKREEAKTKMNHLADKSSRIIYKCKTVWPFDFFPDELSIEDHRLNIVTKQFFATGELRTVSIQDIFEVSVTTDLFFAAIRIGARVFVDGTIQINYLNKAEAIRFQQTLEGLRVLIQEGVDTTVMETHELLEKIEEIGRIRNRQRL